MSAVAEYEFGPFRLIPHRQELLRDGVKVVLGSRSFALLHILVAAAGELVSREALFAAVWPGQIVAYNNISVAIAGIRKALGCGVDGASYIATVTGRGCRFVAPVRVCQPAIGLPTEVETVAPLLGNLPRISSPLIGRETDTNHVLDLLERARIVTITGSGGVGKTRLALAVAEAAGASGADGVWFVDLAPLTGPELVTEATAEVFGISAQGRRTATGAITMFLRRKRLLLILDNCEHVVAEVAGMVETISTHCPEVRILATSREPLNVSDEHVFRLLPLGLPPADRALTASEALGFTAVQLFVTRAAAALGGFALTDPEAPAVAEICRRLDGLPLALELAAARLRMMSLPRLAAALYHRFDVLTGGRRTAAPRQQTLRALIDWSYTLLSVPEQAAMRRLSVFAGSWTLESATAVIAGDPIAADDIFGLMASLVDKSLIFLEPAGDEARFRFLESTRAYAAEKQAGSGEPDLSRRFARCLADRLEQGEGEVQRIGMGAWLRRYRPDLGDVRAALVWAFGPGGDAELGIELLYRTRTLYEGLFLIGESWRWWVIAEANVTPSTPLQFAALAGCLSHYSGGHGQRAILGTALEAVARLRQVGGPSALATALRLAGGAAIQPGNVGEGEAYLREAEELLRPNKPSWEHCTVLGALAAARFFARDFPGALDLLRESIEFAQKIQYQIWVEIATCNIAQVEFALGRRAVAIDLIRRNIEECRGHGNLRALAQSYSNLGSYLLAEGDSEEASAALCTALRLFVAIDYDYQAAICVEHLARVAALAGAFDVAGRLAGYADHFGRERAVVRKPLEAAGWQELQGRLAEAFEPMLVVRLMAEGAAMSQGQAVAMASAIWPGQPGLEIGHRLQEKD